MTNNGYLNCSVVIVSGTGSGQVRKISAYNSSTKVTTVSASWSVNPTSSSVYAIVHDANGLYTQPADGSINYYNFNFGSVGTRKISMYCGDFIGVNIGQTDAIAPSVPISGNLRAVVVVDIAYVVVVVVRNVEVAYS